MQEPKEPIAVETGEPSVVVMVVDDEPLALADTLACVAQADPMAKTQGFGDVRSALAWARRERPDLALLDIEMPQTGGMELARSLRVLYPKIRIVFVTSFESYALEAFSIHAQGYLLKPVDTAGLAYEIEEARLQKARSVEAEVPKVVSPAPVKLLSVVMFGGFEVYSRTGERVAFKRGLTKELLALLVDRRGAGLTLREVVAHLWPEEPVETNKRSYYQSLVSDLRRGLAAVGAEEVLVKSWNSLAVDPSLVDCDLYRLLGGEEGAREECRGAYLPAYAWGEETAGEVSAFLAEADGRD